MALPKHKTAIIIAGPTAVGKTSVAIRLAQHFQTEIISADSRQCYKELNIGVARPSEKELSAVKHYFIASHSIHDEITAAGFENYALQSADEIFNNHDKLVLVGGTGLYIKAFCEGLDTIPSVEPAIRQHIKKKYEEHGIEWLQDEIRKKDPFFFEKGEIQNPQRMMRALEVVESTGRSILSFRKGRIAPREFRIIRIGLEVAKEELHENIYARVDHMVERGLVEEAKSLLPFRHLNALRTVGYNESFEHLDGNLSLEKMVSLIKVNTRQYAKRQMTWFKRDTQMQWTAPSDWETILKIANS